MFIQHERNTYDLNLLVVPVPVGRTNNKVALNITF